MYAHVYEYYRSLFSYCPDTGELTRIRGPYKGKKTGIVGNNGYILVYVAGRLMRAHRVIWHMVYSEDIPEFIDHINRNTSDNRICNLRLATNRQNRANARGNFSVSGYKGVFPSRKRFKAYIYEGSNVVWRATFDTAIEAAKAYNEKAKEMFGEYSFPNAV